jgi:hypothetical protein
MSKMLVRNLCRYSILLLLLLGQYCYGQNCNEDSLFNKFRKDIQIEQEVNQGRVVWDDETKEAYYVLMINCPIAALVKYTDDPNPAVRSAIFAGLAQKNADNDILTEILNKHLNDTAKYTESPTDVVVTWTVSKFMKTGLNLKADKKLTNADYTSRLEEIRSRFHIIVPGAHHGIIAKDSLLRVDSLICSKIGIKIVSFSLTIGNETITTNNVFTEKMKNLFKMAGKGEIVYFDEILAERPDKSLGMLPSIALEIR